MKPDPEPTRWEKDPLAWPRATGQVDQLMAALEVRRQRQRRRRVALATTAAAAAVAIAVFLNLPSAPVAAPPPADLRVVIQRPEQRVLPDGTVVELRPGAELAVNFTGTSAGPREVALTRGEAHFQVAKNPARPFVVHAQGVQFRAVGTAFAVDLAGTAVELLVTEGRVAVEPVGPATNSSSATATLVDAGQHISVAPGAVAASAVTAASTEETHERLAWRVPRLEFNATPLSEVVRLFAVHSGARLALADPALGRLEISGTLRADNPEALLRMLETNYRIAVLRHPDGTITLRREK